MSNPLNALNTIYLEAEFNFKKVDSKSFIKPTRRVPETTGDWSPAILQWFGEKSFWCFS